MIEKIQLYAKYDKKRFNIQQLSLGHPLELKLYKLLEE